jgi:apolipoprotein N-acyltransferase
MEEPGAKERVRVQFWGGRFMNPQQRQALIALVAALTSGIALYLGTGLHPVWWAMWFAPVPVLLAAANLSRRWTFAAAFGAWAAGGLNMWKYYHVALEIPLIPSLLFIALPALVFAGIVLVYRRFLRISGWRAALIFPSLWVVYEFVSARLSPHSTFGNISYSQMDFLPVVQIASITGIWGISFTLFLFAATLSVFLSRDNVRGAKPWLATGVLIWFVLVMGFGIWRLQSNPPAQNTVLVGLVASDLPQNLITVKHADTLRLMREYLGQAEVLAAQGAKVVVIPEKVAVLLDSDLPEVDPMFLVAAQKSGASLVIGVIHATTGAKWNEARLYSPDGEIRTYEKHHMLPSFESQLTAGTARTEWDESSGHWGIAICKDMDFPRLSREYGNDGTALLLVPAWDFVSDGWLHGRMAILRGVESGFTIVRAPKQGILTVTDDTGRVLAERITGSGPFTSLVVAAPVQHSATAYARFGDWFAWLNVAIALCLIVYAAVMPKPQSQGTPQYQPS